MKTAAFFPGQGSQYPGMGKDLYKSSERARKIFEQADDILGFKISETMFDGSADDLKQTNITQPAVFIHSLAAFEVNKDGLTLEAVAGHSLGELSALVASESLSFEQGLLIVKERAESMKESCTHRAGTMAAILGLQDEQVEAVCAQTNGEVIAANYNCPGQLVISGEVEAVEHAVNSLKEVGAKRAIILNVDGAFHSSLMAPARERLQAQIESSVFATPKIPIYQNVDGKPHRDPEHIKQNLIAQLTSPVKWTQTMQQMVADGFDSFIEFGGNGKTLTGFIRRIDRSLNVNSFI